MIWTWTKSTSPVTTAPGEKRPWMRIESEVINAGLCLCLTKIAVELLEVMSTKVFDEAFFTLRFKFEYGWCKESWRHLIINSFTVHIPVCIHIIYICKYDISDISNLYLHRFNIANSQFNRQSPPLLDMELGDQWFSPLPSQPAVAVEKDTFHVVSNVNYMFINMWQTYNMCIYVKICE